MPAALRLLRGQGVRNPPQVPGEAPTMPSGLSDAEITCWQGLMEELQTVPGLVSRADRGVCELVARLEPALRKAAIVVREEGSTLSCFDADGRLKFVQQRPESTFMLKTGALLKTLYAELGLSPSGRSRVALSPSAPDSKLDRFRQERHGR
jgi:phage terminase small subunit